MSALNILVVGATGSIGRLVIDDALGAGHTVRALVRSAASACNLPSAASILVGDLTKTATLSAALAGVDAIAFTHGADAGDKSVVEAVDYGGVRNVLAALDRNAHPRIALMTAIGVTNRTGSYNRSTEAHDWKRRGERLVRASGLPYTIVRPGWFDYNAANEQRPVFLQGDTRQSGTPKDGGIARRQIARVLVRSLSSTAADHKTFELVAETGAEPASFDDAFARLEADRAGEIDAVHDAGNMPLDEEPRGVIDDLARASSRAPAFAPHTA